MQVLAAGEYTVEELAVPPGMKLVQVSGKALADAPFDPWTWAETLSDFSLRDSNGAKQAMHGAWAKVAGQGGSQRVVAKYDMSTPITDLGREEGRPTDVYLAFLVPENTTLKELVYKGKTVHNVNFVVK
jgi:hypothetical protein